MSYLIRLMVEDDLDGVLAVQAEAYADHFHESAQVIAQRLSACGNTTWVAEKSGEVCAYLVAYVSSLGKITAFNSPFITAANPDCLYLHDLAIAQSARGAGLARQLLVAARQFVNESRLAHMALISVQDSGDFWSAFGFVERTGLDIEQEEKLRTYGSATAAAFYMVKKFYH
jgi:ribosomal protein S18 acetylase RimI-like enzyme